MPEPPARRGPNALESSWLNETRKSLCLRAPRRRHQPLDSRLVVQDVEIGIVVVELSPLEGTVHRCASIKRMGREMF